MKRYAFLDENNNPIRFVDYPAHGAVEIKEPEYKIDWNNYEECLL